MPSRCGIIRSSRMRSGSRARKSVGTCRGSVVLWMFRYPASVNSRSRSRTFVGSSSTTRIRASVEALALTARSEEHTSELQSLAYLVCRLLLEKKKKLHTFRKTEGLHSLLNATSEADIYIKKELLVVWHTQVHVQGALYSQESAMPDFRDGIPP